jgi:hypothetical protein
MCQYIQRSPQSWRPASRASASPARAAVEKLAESGFEIGLVRDALLDRRLLGRALDAVSDLASEGRVPMSVSQRDLVRLPGSLESFSRVFANRLQHLEPVLCLDLHERLVHERLEPVE